MELAMNTRLQIDSHHYKCQSCHKVHVGPTRTLDFLCVRELRSEKGVERILEAEFVQRCHCDQMLKLRFQVREFPPGNFSYHGCQSSDADLLAIPNVREHEEIMDEG